MSGGHEGSAESVSNTSTPLGVMAVSLIVGLYGLLWLLSSFTAIYGQPYPNFVALLGPFIGLILLLIAIGLWNLKWPAWALTVMLFGAIIILNILQITTLTLDSIPFVPFLIVIYLFFKQEAYFQRTGS